MVFLGEIRNYSWDTHQSSFQTSRVMSFPNGGNWTGMRLSFAWGLQGPHYCKSQALWFPGSKLCQRTCPQSPPQIPFEMWVTPNQTQVCDHSPFSIQSVPFILSSLWSMYFNKSPKCRIKSVRLWSGFGSKQLAELAFWWLDSKNLTFKCLIVT